MKQACVTRGALGAVLVCLVVFSTPMPAIAQQPEWPAPIHDDQVFWLILVDQLEYARGTHHDPIAWDAKAWMGGDFNRLWIKSEGGRSTNRRGGEFEVQALYSRLIAPFWELQAGLRVDRQLASPNASMRAHLAFGIEGLAPYWFELEPVVFVSDDGDVSARIEASYDLLFSQRLVLRPELEVNFGVQEVEEWRTGSGLVDASLALRLRYEIRREFAPYAGVEWAQRFGQTAEYEREAGEDVVEWSFLAGFRVWF